MYQIYNTNFTNIAQYTNYWRRPMNVSGTGSSESSLIAENQKPWPENIWKIFLIITTVIVVVVLVMSTYNTVTYTECSEKIDQYKALLNSRNTAATSDTTTTTTTTTTTATTTVATTTTTASTASDTSSGDDGSATTARTQVTTSQSEGACQSGLFPFGDDDIARLGEVMSLKLVMYCKVLGTTLPMSIDVNFRTGRVNMATNTQELVQVKMLYTVFAQPDPNKGEHFYFRQVGSTSELAVIGCLVGNDKVDKAYVLTWKNMLDRGTKYSMGTLQCVLAFSGKDATYVIRNFGDDVPALSQKKVQVLDQVHDSVLDEDVTVAQVVGKRLINDLTNAAITSKHVARQNGQCQC